MRVETYTNRKGVKRYRPVITSFSDTEQGGICIACGKKHRNIEPDARGYNCEKCGEPKRKGSAAGCWRDTIISSTHSPWANTSSTWCMRRVDR